LELAQYPDETAAYLLKFEMKLNSSQLMSLNLNITKEIVIVVGETNVLYHLLTKVYTFLNNLKADLIHFALIVDFFFFFLSFILIDNFGIRLK
jgi:hypothetical protein